MEKNNVETACLLRDEGCPLSAPQCKRGAVSAERPLDKETPLERTESVTGKLMHLFRHCFLFLGRRHHHAKETTHPGQERILGFLARHDRVSQRSLTEETRLRAASLGELLQKIEKNGYIVRERDENDKRSQIISLTASGKEAVTSAEREHQAQAEKLFSALTTEEQEQLAILLKKLAAAWEVEAGELPEHEHLHHHGHGPREHGPLGHGPHGHEPHEHGPHGHEPLKHGPHELNHHEDTRDEHESNK